MVVTDVRLYRDGLVASLRSRSNLQVLSNVDGVPVLDQILEVGPDVVLIDTATQHSLEIVRTLRERAPATKAVVFAIHEYGGEVVKYAEAGAAGYVACDASFDQLVSAIEAVAREELVCPPRIASTLFRRLGAYGRSGVSSSAAVPTHRERQVYALIRDGLSNKEIAHALHVAEPTVKNHVHSLLEKLKAKNRTQLAGRDTVATPSSRRLPTVTDPLRPGG